MARLTSSRGVRSWRGAALVAAVSVLGAVAAIDAAAAAPPGPAPAAPLIPVSVRPQPAIMAAQPAPGGSGRYASVALNSTPTYTSNWSGYVLQAASGGFTSLTGCWRVPALAGTQQAGATYSATWIGLDGATSSDLSSIIQTGTEQDWSSGSGATYAAWWELYPAPPVAFGGVSAGDSVCAAIGSAGGGYFSITLDDVSASRQWSTTQYYAGPDATAEWIEEAPADYVDGELCIEPLAAYGTVSITGSVNGGNPQLGYPSEAYLMKPDEPAGCPAPTPLGNNSTPSLPNSAGNGFATEYGTTTPSAPPPPAAVSITSVSPTVGSQGGGGTLQVDGGGFEPGAMVLVGPSASSSVTYVSSTELTATLPPNPLYGYQRTGVTVLNPDGGVPGGSASFTWEFLPPDVGAPTGALTPGGGQELVFWAGQGASAGHLEQSWYDFSPQAAAGVRQQWFGPWDLTGALGIPSGGALASAPTVVFTPDGGQQLVFWQGQDGDLWEAWYTLATGAWNDQDLTGAEHLAGAGGVASSPTVTFTPGGGQQLVFWRGSNGDTWEAWYTVATATWRSTDLNTAWLGGAGAGSVASRPTVVLTPGGGRQLVFWQAAGSGHVDEAWYTVATATWRFQDLTAAGFPAAAGTASEPDVILTPGGGQQLLFWQGASTGDLWEAWFTVATATWQAQDLTAAHLGGTGSVASMPALTVTPDGGQQLLFWQTTAGHLDEAWYTVATATWQAQDLTASQGLPSDATLGGPPSLALLGDGEQDVFWEGSPLQELWELAYSPATGRWHAFDWSADA